MIGEIILRNFLFSFFPFKRLLDAGAGTQNRTQKNKNRQKTKTRSDHDVVLERRGSFDDEVLDGDRDEYGGHGQQGDDEERELFVRQAAFWLLGL